MTTPDSTPGPSAIEHLNFAAPTRLGLPFSEIVRVDRTLYWSGQIGTPPGTWTLAASGLALGGRSGSVVVAVARR